MMLSSRYGPGLVLAGLLALALGCGGGGGGGGGSSNDGKPPPDPPPALTVTGVLGGGQSGWHLGAAPPGDDERSFDGARDIFVAGDGTIYVAEYGNGRVSKWSAAGEPLGWIGHGQDGWQTGKTPIWPGWGYLATDAAGNVYLGAARTIFKLTPDGNVVGWLGDGTDGWQTGNPPWFGGSDLRSFLSAEGIHVTADGTIYAADSRNHRIAKWSADGMAIGWLGGGTDGWKTIDSTKPDEDAQGRPIGLDDLRSFLEPADVFVADDGTIYVLDRGHHRVTKWSADGVAQGAIGGSDLEGWRTEDVAGFAGAGERLFDSPRSVYVDASGDVYVADPQNGRVSRWNATGFVVGWIGHGGTVWQRGDAPTSTGTDESFFGDVRDVLVLADGTVLVADAALRRVSRWSAAGSPTGWLGGGQDGWQTGDAPGGHHDLGWFLEPWGLALDGSGRLLVVDVRTRRVSRWTMAGVAEARFGRGPRGGPGSLYEPVGVCVDADGTIYVAENASYRVSRWSADGLARGWIGDGSDGWTMDVADTYDGGDPDDRAFRGPAAVCVDRGYLYVPDGSVISRWDVDGVYRGRIGHGGNGWTGGTTLVKKAHMYSSEASMYIFGKSSAVTTAADGTLFVTDRAVQRVVQWSPWAEALGWLGGGKNGMHTYPAIYDTTPDKEKTEGGRGSHRFAHPVGVALDGDGHLYVADRLNQRICAWRLTRDSAVALGWIGHGSEIWQRGLAPDLEPEQVDTDDPRSFASSGGIHVTADGTLYAADGKRILRWSRVGAD